MHWKAITGRSWGADCFYVSKRVKVKRILIFVWNSTNYSEKTLALIFNFIYKIAEVFRQTEMKPV
ncbi:hypothetical protein DOM24_06015 [Acinetobacter radioresistens]|nr:hypothetical protein DOM24_06015 [Acinetobacter radioresistens]